MLIALSSLARALNGTSTFGTESVMQDFLYYLSLDQTHWIISMVLFLLIAPLEKRFPRVKTKANSPNIVAIIIIAICSYATIWLFKQSMYLLTISAFLNLQIFSLSKSNLPVLAIYIISFLFIDLLVYTFHFISHKIPLLWKLHSVHHADEHVNSKTAVLHHPLELLASMIFVLFFAVILGIPIISLILFAAIATLHNFFAHANIALPYKVDRLLRYLIITPDLHRTHHSIDMIEGNSNFGQVFTIWDRIFKTYIDQPNTSEDKLIMGLPKSERPNSLKALDLLLHPIAKLLRK